MVEVPGSSPVTPTTSPGPEPVSASGLSSFCGETFHARLKKRGSWLLQGVRATAL